MFENISISLAVLGVKVVFKPVSAKIEHLTSLKKIKTIIHSTIKASGTNLIYEGCKYASGSTGGTEVAPGSRDKKLSRINSEALCKRFFQHGDAHHVVGRGGENLHILAQSAVLTESREGALDHPTLGQNDPMVFAFGRNMQH
jgi:hypothetical protein